MHRLQQTQRCELLFVSVNRSGSGHSGVQARGGCNVSHKRRVIHFYRVDRSFCNFFMLMTAVFSIKARESALHRFLTPITSCTSPPAPASLTHGIPFAKPPFHPFIFAFITPLCWASSTGSSFMMVGKCHRHRQEAEESTAATVRWNKDCQKGADAEKLSSQRGGWWRQGGAFSASVIFTGEGGWVSVDGCEGWMVIVDRGGGTPREYSSREQYWKLNRSVASDEVLHESAERSTALCNEAWELVAVDVRYAFYKIIETTHQSH